MESAPPGDSLILLGDFNAYIDSDSETCRGVVGRKSPPDLDPSCVARLLCLSWIVLTNTMLAPGHLRLQFHD